MFLWLSPQKIFSGKYISIPGKDLRKMNQQQTKLMGLRSVMEAFDVSRSKIYTMVKAGELPRPIFLGRRSARWLASDVNERIVAIVKKQRKAM